ncbi:unnamed protein product [Amoebophrya sp. A25]|nr:unnamed protein product [Amoebophrya sp. A25]|eukprot:GSA25T00015241001.1
MRRRAEIEAEEMRQKADEERQERRLQEVQAELTRREEERRAEMKCDKKLKETENAGETRRLRHRLSASLGSNFVEDSASSSSSEAADPTSRGLVFENSHSKNSTSSSSGNDGSSANSLGFPSGASRLRASSESTREKDRSRHHDHRGDRDGHGSSGGRTTGPRSEKSKKTSKESRGDKSRSPRTGSADKRGALGPDTTLLRIEDRELRQLTARQLRARHESTLEELQRIAEEKVRTKKLELEIEKSRLREELRDKMRVEEERKAEDEETERDRYLSLLEMCETAKQQVQTSRREVQELQEQADNPPAQSSDDDAVKLLKLSRDVPSFLPEAGKGSKATSNRGSARDDAFLAPYDFRDQAPLGTGSASVMPNSGGIRMRPEIDLFVEETLQERDQAEDLPSQDMDVTASALDEAGSLILPSSKQTSAFNDDVDAMLQGVAARHFPRPQRGRRSGTTVVTFAPEDRISPRGRALGGASMANPNSSLLVPTADMTSASSPSRSLAASAREIGSTVLTPRTATRASAMSTSMSSSAQRGATTMASSLLSPGGDTRPRMSKSAGAAGIAPRRRASTSGVSPYTRIRSSPSAHPTSARTLIQQRGRAASASHGPRGNSCQPATARGSAYETEISGELQLEEEAVLDAMRLERDAVSERQTTEERLRLAERGRRVMQQRLECRTASKARK